MPFMTEHAPFHFDRFALTSVRVCRQSYSKTDRRTVRLAHTHTDTHAHTQTDCPKPLFSTFRWLYIPTPFKLDFLHIANTSMGQLSESGTLPEYKVLFVTGFSPCL